MEARGHHVIGRARHQKARLVGNDAARAVLGLAEGPDGRSGQADEGRHLGVGCGQRLDRRPAGGMADGPELGGVDVVVEGTRRGVVLAPHEGDGRLEIVDVGRLLRGRGRATQDLGQVAAVVIGRGHDEAPRGQERREEGGLVPESGVAVTEHDQRVATRGHGDVRHPATRVGHGEPGRHQLLECRRQPGRYVVGGDGLAGDAGLGRRVPDLDRCAVRRQGERRLADAERAGTGEAVRAEVRHRGHHIAVHRCRARDVIRGGGRRPGGAGRRCADESQRGQQTGASPDNAGPDRAVATIHCAPPKRLSAACQSVETKRCAISHSSPTGTSRSR